MISKLNFIKNKLGYPLIISLLIVIGFLVFYGKTYKDYRGRPHQFIYDVNNYYSYLPAIFIHHDLSFSFPHDYWLMPTEKGTLVAKATYGMSAMYAPFFLIGHLQAGIRGEVQDGYSKSYSTWVRNGTHFYAILALFFLIKSLSYFYSRSISAITAMLIFFGTTYFYYVAGSGELTHSYLFALLCGVIYFTIKWHHTQKPGHLYLLSFILGFSVLIRPTEIVSILFPLMYGVVSKDSLKEKMSIVSRNWKQFIPAALIFALPFIPQLIYWKYYTGSFVFYSYGTDRFFFNDPKILEVLFSYRKGFLLYSPLIIFALLGFFRLRKQGQKIIIPVLFIFLIQLYLVSCWWDWWFGGCFGYRALVQHISFLAFPLAAFIHYIFTQKQLVIKGLFSIIAMGLIYLNMFQSLQFKNSIIHWDSMTREAYWYGFGKLSLQADEWQELEKLIKAPDYEKTKEGFREIE